MSEPQVEPKAEETPKSYSQAEVDEMVSGLKSNNEKLLGEKKTAQAERTAQEEISRAAREEAAKKSGDVEAIEKSLNERHQLEVDSYKEKLTKRDNLILGERNVAVVNDLSSDFIDTFKGLGKTILNTMVETSYNDDGQPVTKYKDQAGNLLTTELTVFKEYLKTNDAFKSLLKGVQMDGGGATGSNGNGGGATDFSKMTRTQKTELANSNPDLFAKLNKR